MNHVIRAGIVGVASIGKNHARIYSELPGVRFSAILDTNLALLLAHRHWQIAGSGICEWLQLAKRKGGTYPGCD
jgi:predicted dehydrogenase